MQLAIIAGVCVLAIVVILYVVYRMMRMGVVCASSPWEAIAVSGLKDSELGKQDGVITATWLGGCFWRVEFEPMTRLPQ